MKFEIDSDEELWIEDDRLSKEDIQYLVNTLYSREFKKLKEETEAKLDDLLYTMINDQEVEDVFKQICTKPIDFQSGRKTPDTP